MLYNYIRFALLNMIRNRLFTAINILGLAISLTAFLLMALYIEFELSVDRFHSNADRIYRVADDKQAPDILLKSAASAAPVAPALKIDFPEIVEAVRIIPAEALVKYGTKLFEERNMFFADPEIFKVFTFKIIKGNPASALTDPMKIVMTDEMAVKYFGNTNPVGKVITLDGKDMIVSAIVERMPGNSTIKFDFLISMATAQQPGSGYDWLFTNWYSNHCYTYLLLPEKYEVGKLAARMEAFDEQHRPGGSDTKHHFVLEKLTDIYLYSERDNQVGKTGSLSNLHTFAAVALIILALACINFINLTTARATERAKEVAVKKVAGAFRNQVMLQFFTESFVMTTMALSLAIIFTITLLPAFNTFSGKLLGLQIFSLSHLFYIVALLFGIGILSGAYPAILLSGFSPANALKGKLKTSAWNIGVRQGLVVVQFSVSVGLIVCSLVVYEQLNFMQKHDLGFEPSQTLVINFEGDSKVQQKFAAIREELLRIPGVNRVTVSSNVPGDTKAGDWSMEFAKKNGDSVKTEFPIYLADYNYLQQYNVPIVAGRGFSNKYQADTVESMLINETALKELGFSTADEAIGIAVGMYPSNARIIGVFKDFHFESLKKAIRPLAMRVLPANFRLFSLDIKTTDINGTITRLENTWKQLVPGRPLEYSFLDENFNRQYVSEMQFGKIFSIFATLAIIIACLGLFGLALFSIGQRTKEIGIRKVLGASISGITALLSKDFIKLVLVAIVIAAPVSWVIMSRWLQEYSYRISISFWTYIIAGAGALLIAFLTVSFNAIRGAMANPVKCLRAE